MTSPVLVKTKGTKAVMAALGTTLTALMTILATVSVATGDDAIDIGEVGTITTAVLSGFGTIYAVWKVRNEPVEGQAYRSNRV